MFLSKLATWMLIFIIALFIICTAFADEKVLETRYHLDTGVYFIYGKDGVEESWVKGIYNSPIIYTLENGINLAVNRDPSTIKIINITPYDGNNFDFDKPEQYTWNKTPYGIDQKSYRSNYMKYMLTNLKSMGSPQYDIKTGNLIFGYSGVLKSYWRDEEEKLQGEQLIIPWDKDFGDFNVKSNVVFFNGVSDIEKWMGSIPAEMQTQLEKIPNQASDDSLKYLMYFAPMVIEYQIIDPTPLISPMVLLDCKAGSMFIGLQTPVRGSVLNRNEKPVITYYTLTVNGSKVLQSGCVLQDGGKSKKVDSSYTIPGNTKPGTQFVFKLEARQTWAYDAPNRYLPKEEGKPREVNPEYEPFINSHTYVSAVNAWYENDGPWVTGEAICRKSAVLLPEAPLNHEMNPSVIVE